MSRQAAASARHARGCALAACLLLYLRLGSTTPLHTHRKVIDAEQPAAGLPGSSGSPAASTTAAWQHALPSGRTYSWSVDNNLRVVGRPGGDPGQLAPVDVLADDVVAVAAAGHSLAVTADGGLLSWGRNDSQGGGGGGSAPVADAGQLGALRAADDLALPAKVGGTGPGGVRLVAVAAGRYHSLGLSQEGGVLSWGLNDQDQAAAPCQHGAHCRSGRPGPVAILDDLGAPAVVVAIAAGRYHSLALTQAGQVYSWGLSACGSPDLAQAGLLPAGRSPADYTSPTPRLVGGALTGVRIVSVDAGYVHWIAVADTGDVYTCATGSDGYAGGLPTTQQAGGWAAPGAQGELGRPVQPGPSSLMPGKVPGVKATSVAAGRCFSLAVGMEGQVFSWGCAGALGRPAGAGADPAPVAGLGPGTPAGRVTAVAAAEWTAAAITASGQVWAWGNTGPGQAGATASPVLLRDQPAGARAVAISGAHQHFLVIFAQAPPARHARHLQRQPPAACTRPSECEALEAARAAQASLRVQRQRQLADAAAIRAAAPDIFERLAPFDPAYKNPCFRDASTARLRCLPYFSIIGVSKCGTTDLYQKLAQFPGLVAPSRNKGPHFWDEAHAFDWYLDLYDDVAAQVAAQPHLVTGDASSNTFTYSGVGIRGAANDAVLLPWVLRAAQPAMKVILMLRNPVDRMYSAFWYYGCLYNNYQQYGMSPQGFHAMAQVEVSKVSGCLREGRGVTACARTHYHDAQQLVKGMYSAFLPDWLDVYDSDSTDLMVINTDEYRDNEASTLRDVFTFLELPVPSWDQLINATSMSANRGHNKHSNVPGCSGERGAMLSQTRRMLEMFYHPMNNDLSVMLEEGSYNWPLTVPVDVPAE